MSDITLSKAVRSNLLSLQNTASLMSKTQERLATGNKVNSALDNPTNFFTASSLNSRAGDINQLLDGMANGIQTIEAADNGLTAITKTLESIQSTLRQARQDKSFQTASLSLDPDTVGTAAARNLTFGGGSIEGTEAINLQNTVKIGNNGFTDNGTAGAAGDLSIQAAGLNGGNAISISFSATDTAQSVAAKINDQVRAVGGSSSGISASVVDGQLKIASSAGENITLGTTGDSARYIGLAAGQTAKVDATSQGTAVAAGAISAFTLSINGQDIEIEATASTNTAAQNRTHIIDTINASGVAQSQGIVATESGTNQITLTQGAGRNFSVEGGAAGWATAATTTNGVQASGDVTAITQALEVKTVDQLVSQINNDDNLKGKIRASNDNGKLRIENLSTQELAIDGASSSGDIDGTSSNSSFVGGNTVRADLTRQYNELRDQLDKLADDASFNGINLLRGDNLKITFNETGTSEIDIQSKGGISINADSLGIRTNLEQADFDSDAKIDEFLGEVKTAINTVRSQASAFGSSLAIVQNRQDFSRNMINTLQTGASNLTLADANEEAANLLALQTRQQLSSTALSMASQADQAVLRLF